ARRAFLFPVLKEQQERKTRNDGRRGNIRFPHDNHTRRLPCLIRGVAIIVGGILGARGVCGVDDLDHSNG
ncbi:MAG: hypothetical protein ACE5I0_00705, partial [Candidatus Binatia bacterium]